MRARSVSIGSMFSWIPSCFRLVTGHAGAMMVGSLIMLVCVIALFLPMMFFMVKAMPAPGALKANPLALYESTSFWIAYGVSIVAALLLFPPMLAGWFRMCADADRGVAISGVDVLAPYRDGGTWMRLLGLALILLVTYLLVFGLLFLAFQGTITGLMAASAAQQAAVATGGAPPPFPPGMMAGIILVYLVGLPAMMLMQFMYLLSFAEVSLRPTNPLSAFGEAAGGTFRNLLKLLVCGFCIFVLAVVVFLIVALVLGLLMAVTMMINQYLGLIVVAIFEIGVFLLVYPLMFAFHYFAWKDVLGGELPADPNALAV